MKNLQIENIGWTLGNECPYKCPQCYSMMVRSKGRDLEKKDVDRIVKQIASIGVKTINLGGNEPIFTNGINPKDTLLPYIIRSIYDAGIKVGLTTAGISLIYLERFYPETLAFLNDVDVSFDSPFRDEHNKNRGTLLYEQAIKALKLCIEYGMSHTIIMCGMNWNLSDEHIDALLIMARKYDAFVRINFIKPTESQHMNVLPSPQLYFKASNYLLSQCDVVEMGESLISAATKYSEKGCPCGTRSFRIHSMTPEGKIPVSPCVYAHDYKTGDLLTEELGDIIESIQFQVFRSRRNNPKSIDGCDGCGYLEYCRGGCASRAYLTQKFSPDENGLDLFVKDPYCLKDFEEQIEQVHSPMVRTYKRETSLVHQTICVR